MRSHSALKSDRGTVTAELAIALPAVLLVLSFAIQVLAVQVERVSLVTEVASLARSAARGEVVSGSKVYGNLICVTKKRELVLPIVEKQCARRLGL